MDDMSVKISAVERIFREKLNVVPLPLEEIPDVEGDIFRTDDSNIIYVEMLLRDFSVDELVRMVSISEALCDKYDCHCTCYILCYGDVTVNEMPILSDKDFTIRLAQSDMNHCEVILNIVKSKLMRGILLDEEDINALYKLPMVCKVEDRNFYRKEVFNILNMLGL